MVKLLKRARKNHISSIYLYVLEKSSFLLKWYKKIGFQESGWVEMEAKLQKIKI